MADHSGEGDASYNIATLHASNAENQWPTRIHLRSLWCKCAAIRSRRRTWRPRNSGSARRRRPAQIVCLPELFLSPYFCQKQDIALFDLAEPIPGPSTETLSRVARDAGVVVVASLFEKRAVGVYHNTAVVFDRDGTMLGIYRKMHIPDDPLYFEKYYFTPGDLGFRCFDTKAARVGTLVCWDQWFPEGAAPHRAARRRTARLSDRNRLASEGKS